MRLLPRARPYVDLTIVEMLALPIERSVVGGHGLDDEIMRLPEAVHDPDRIRIRGRELVGHALNETHIEAAARDHVDGGKLFRDAQRIGAVADRIAEHENARAF